MRLRKDRITVDWKIDFTGKNDGTFVDADLLSHISLLTHDRENDHILGCGYNEAVFKTTVFRIKNTPNIKFFKQVVDTASSICRGI